MKKTISTYSVTGNTENVNMSQKLYIHSSFKRLSWLHIRSSNQPKSEPKITIKMRSHLSTKMQTATLICTALYLQIKGSFANISCGTSWCLAETMLAVLTPDQHKINYLCFKKLWSNNFVLRPRRLKFEFCKVAHNYSCGKIRHKCRYLNKSNFINLLHGFWLYNIWNMYEA